MRPVPILVALLVAATLYLLVFDRAQLLSFAGRETRGTTEAPAADPSAPAATQSSPAMRVVVLPSEARPVETAVILRGRTEASREVTVAVETSGRVITPPLRKGATVAEGDALCRLDPGIRETQLAEARARLAEAESRVPEAEAAIAEAEARLRATDIETAAARQLSEGGFASETRRATAEAASEGASAGISRARSALTAAQAGIEAATASVEAAEREIDRLTITAPFAGLLETDTAELGTLLQPGQPCATIVQIDPLHVIGFAPELDVARLTDGAPARARLATGQTVDGRISFIARAADPQTRTFRVEVTVPNADGALRDGQTADLMIPTDGLSAHLVPQSALTLDDGGNLGVRTVDDDSITRFAPVRVIRDEPDGVWIAGLPERARIITVGQDFVTEGVPVTAVERGPEG